MAEEMGLEAGDLLKSVNGKPLEDIIDYRYLCADQQLELEVAKENGETWIFEVEKEIDEDLGILFQEDTFDGIRRCRNKCLFCFIDQLPPQMRQTLYVKDDDYRHSFLHGNFITLTNASRKDLERIISLRLSPLYVSVHTTNPQLRRSLLANRKAAHIMEQLDFLTSNCIDIHTQVVLCPGLNDGEELKRTIDDLAGLGPHLRSMAVVPVGLTAFRENCYPLRQFTPGECWELVESIGRLQLKFLSQMGTRFVFLADEFYLAAGVDIPPKESYEDFAQLENGVGLVRLFVDDFRQRLENETASTAINPRTVVVVTGRLMACVLAELAKEAERMVDGLRVRVLPVENRLFGPMVTVTGLLTGKDLVEGLAGRVNPDQDILISDVMLKEDDHRFLDDMTVSAVEAKLGVSLHVVPNNGRALAEHLLGRIEQLCPNR